MSGISIWDWLSEWGLLNGNNNLVGGISKLEAPKLRFSLFLIETLMCLNEILTHNNNFYMPYPNGVLESSCTF